MSAFLSYRTAQGQLEPTPRAGEPRHHGADGDLDDLPDLLVGKAVQLPQDDHLAEFERQRLDRPTHRGAVRGPEQGGLGMLSAGPPAVELIVEFDGDRVRAAAAMPCVAGVTNDRQHPGAGVIPSEPVEVLEGA